MARVRSRRIKCVLSPCDPFKRNQSVILYDGFLETKSKSHGE
jgi:hypothetical protein